MKRILSIDGGGIRGIIPALILARLERQARQPASKLFDLIAGTSTGGILALGLAKPDSEGRPEFSALDLSEMYERQGGRIFRREGLRRFLPIGNLLEEKYSARSIEGVLGEYFGDLHLHTALTDLLITSYEIERRCPFFFRSHAAREDASYDFLMRDVARATSAAPTYFEPLLLPASGGEGYYALVDGGVFANNPALCALVEARRIYGDREDIVVVSLGTGALNRPLPYSEARGWGIAQWVKPVLDIAFDGVSSTVDYQLRTLLPDRYWRIQPTLHPSLQEMDNASPANIRGLKQLAEHTIREQSREIDRLAEVLLQSTVVANEQ